MAPRTKVSDGIYGAVIASLAVLAGCDWANLCGNDVVTRIPSPEGSRSFVVFERDCGAMTRFSTQVSLLPLRGQPDSVGNVLILDADHGRVPVNDRGVISVEIKWVDEHQAVISYPAGARVSRTIGKIEDVSISYATR
jgi:hypothetical protein